MGFATARATGSKAAPISRADQLLCRVRRDRRLDAYLELLLLKYAAKINEGNHGVILLVHRSQVPARLWRRIVGAGIPLGANDFIIKFQRRFRQGAARAEFERQEQAYRMVSAFKGLDPHACVPEPYFYRDLVLRRLATLARLQQTGLTSRRRMVPIIGMEFVPGPDLGTLVYRWILDQAPPGRAYLERGLNRDDFQYLRCAVAKILGFSKPGGKGATAQGRGLGDRVSEFDNAEKVYAFLRRKGFFLDVRLIDQVLATLKLFHVQDFCHQDVHARNVMVTGLDTAHPQGWLIDFEPNQLRLHESPLRQRQADLAFPRSLEQFARSPDHRVNEEANRQRGEFQALASRLSADPRWQADYSRTLARLKSNPQRELENQFRMARAEPAERFMVLLKALVDQGHLEREAAWQFVESKIAEPDIPFRLHNELRVYRRLLTGDEAGTQ